VGAKWFYILEVITRITVLLVVPVIVASRDHLDHSSGQAVASVT
jgi:hypothetical protein